MKSITGKFFNYYVQWSTDPQCQLLRLSDHLGGFSHTKKSEILDELVNVANKYNIKNVETAYVFDKDIANQYPNVQFLYNQSLVGGHGWERLQDYNIHPTVNFLNFVCSFNGSQHVSRKLLTAVLNRFGYFDPDTCSKNFTYSTEVLDGHVLDYTNSMHRFYRNFFIGSRSEEFFQTINSFGHVRFDHAQNIYNLEHQLTQSFLHLVSETMATSYYPFVTEKFLYSIVTRGLFLAYAQPGWHAHVETYYGFKKYSKLFDYRFDSIQNPVERLVELMTMISKFSVLSADDWRDLYSMEADTVEFNYEHYFSGDYLKSLEKYV